MGSSRGEGAGKACLRSLIWIQFPAIPVVLHSQMPSSILITNLNWAPFSFQAWGWRVIGVVAAGSVFRRILLYLFGVAPTLGTDAYAGRVPMAERIA